MNLPLPLARLFVAAALAAAPALVACGEKSEPSPAAQASTTTTTATPSPGTPLVSYARSGGVAAFQEILTVTRNGGAKLELGFLPNASLTRFELTNGELELLNDTLDAADLEPGDAPETGCADCLQYEITTADGTSRFDENAIPPGAEDLIRVLEKIVADNIPAQAAAAAQGAGAN